MRCVVCDLGLEIAYNKYFLFSLEPLYRYTVAPLLLSCNIKCCYIIPGIDFDYCIFSIQFQSVI